MITAKAVVDAGICLKRLDIDGHSEYAEAGEDIICSAVSILTRTAGRILLSHLKNNCESVSGERGSFKLTVSKIPEGKREWMKGITEFLLNGLSDLERDYSAFIKLEITINEEINHES